MNIFHAFHVVALLNFLPEIVSINGTLLGAFGPGPPPPPHHLSEVGQFAFIGVPCGLDLLVIEFPTLLREL